MQGGCSSEVVKKHVSKQEKEMEISEGHRKEEEIGREERREE